MVIVIYTSMHVGFTAKMWGDEATEHVDLRQNELATWRIQNNLMVHPDLDVWIPVARTPGILEVAPGRLHPEVMTRYIGDYLDADTDFREDRIK